MRDELVREWLSRSGQLSLSVYVYTDMFKDHIQESSASNFLSVIQILNGHSGRWRHLTLKIPSFFFWRFHGASRDACTLHTLHILTQWSYYDEENGLFALMNAEPRPRNVSISHFRLKSVHIQWNSITHINVDGLHVDECIELLQRAPQLTDCKLTDIDETRSYFPIPDRPVVHHRLRDFRVEFGGIQEDDDLERFFNSMTLPCLTSFGCSMCDGCLPEELLISFFNRSSCRLRTLRIADTIFEDEDLERLLRATPSLWHLDLSSHIDSSPAEDAPQDIFLLLAETSIIPSHDLGTGDEPFLPQLRSLIYVPAPPFSWMNILAAFGSGAELENPQRRPLKNLTVHSSLCDNGGCPIIDRKSVLRLMKLKNAGFNIKIDLEDDHRDLLELSMSFHGIYGDDVMTGQD